MCIYIYIASSKYVSLWTRIYKSVPCVYNTLGNYSQFGDLWVMSQIMGYIWRLRPKVLKAIDANPLWNPLRAAGKCLGAAVQQKYLHVYIVCNLVFSGIY